MREEGERDVKKTGTGRRGKRQIWANGRERGKLGEGMRHMSIGPDYTTERYAGVGRRKERL